MNRSDRSRRCISELKLREIKSWGSRRIHCRQDILVEHVEVDVQPAAVKRAGGEISRDQVRGCLDPHGEDTLDNHAHHLRARYVAIGPVEGLAERVSLAKNRVFVAHERAINVWPLCEQQLAAASGEREIHSRRRAQVRTRAVISGMEEVAVAIDMHETATAGQTSADEAAKKHAAIAPNRDWKCPPTSAERTTVLSSRENLRIASLLRTRVPGCAWKS